MLARACFIGLVSLALLAPPVAAQQTPPPPGQDRVVAVKMSLQASMAALRQYEWIETTVVSLKGEEKSSKENRCYYGADGKVQKVPVASAPESDGKKPRGLRGKVVENKKEDMSESMKEAIALVKEYVPPQPERIQAAKDAGRVTVSPPDAQGKVRMVINDYLKAGDSLAIDLDAASNHLAGLTVASYTDKEKHGVGLKVGFQALADGTMYAASIALDVKEEDLTVAIKNSGYRKASS